MRRFTTAGCRGGRLDLDLLETVLPEGGVGGDTVLAEVNQDVPELGLAMRSGNLERCSI